MIDAFSANLDTCIHNFNYEKKFIAHDMFYTRFLRFSRAL